MKSRSRSRDRSPPSPPYYAQKRFFKGPLKARRGIFEAGIMIIAILVILIAIAAVAVGWGSTFSGSYITITTHMPKFFTEVNGESIATDNYRFFEVLRNISGIVMVFAIIFAGMSFMLEKFNMFPPETGFKILSSSLFFIMFFFFFPYVWDTVATIVEQLSLYLMNPEPIEAGESQVAHQQENVQYLITELTSPIAEHQSNSTDTVGLDSFQKSLDLLVNTITNPTNLITGIFTEAILGLIKGIAFIMLMFISFLIGTIREVLTAVVMVALPMTMILSLFPFFKRITDKFHDTLLGLMIAPIFTAIVIAAGSAYMYSNFGTFGQGALTGCNIGIDAESVAGACILDPGERLMKWFSALGIVLLASIMPALVAPLMGPVMSAVQGIATSAVSTGTMVGGMAALGGATSAAGSIGKAISSNQAGGGSLMDLARGAFTGKAMTGFTKNVLGGMGEGMMMGAKMGRGELGRVTRAASRGLGGAGIGKSGGSGELSHWGDPDIETGFAQVHTNRISKVIPTMEASADNQNDVVNMPADIYHVQQINSASPPQRAAYFEEQLANNFGNKDTINYVKSKTPDLHSNLINQVGTVFTKNPANFVQAHGSMNHPDPKTEEN